jgi:hypothetical protein
MLENTTISSRTICRATVVGACLPLSNTTHAAAIRLKWHELHLCKRIGAAAKARSVPARSIAAGTLDGKLHMACRLDSASAVG